ncbi:MAG: hypothetical protein U1U88_002117 [Lawsonella clevelandensis]
MNLHGYLARESVHYGSEEALDFTNIYLLLCPLLRPQGIPSTRSRTQ